jgi:hypothetical protein
MNVVICAQLLLIGLGVVLQLAARMAWRDEFVGVPRERKLRARTTEPTPQAKSRRLSSTQVRPSAREKDYYEMERTPQGVRPGDLAKTAKVKYVDGAQPPTPD